MKSNHCTFLYAVMPITRTLKHPQGRKDLVKSLSLVIRGEHSGRKVVSGGGGQGLLAGSAKCENWAEPWIFR